MTRLRTFTLMSIAVFGLSACLSEGIDRDSKDGIIMITHTGPGTLYWQ